MATQRKYPFYMYHKEHDEPLRVDNKDEERQLAEKGWEPNYIHKEYPKWVKGKIVKSKAEHEAFLEEFPDMEVGKGEVVEDYPAQVAKRRK